MSSLGSGLCSAAGEARRAGPVPPGEVIAGVGSEGRRLGRTLGFPTANVVPPAGRLPAFGVYAVRVRLADGRTLGGVANLGRRPTFGGTAPLLETHLFDFSADLYGQRLEVQLVAHLRDERRFSRLDDLQRQMEADARAARSVLAGASVRTFL